MREEEKKELNELLQNLIQIKSENPPGDERKVANFIKGFLSKNDICSESVPLEEGRDSLVVMLPGKEERNITFCGHLDTVRVKEEDWSKPPFQGVIENGKMYGIGASDVKGGVASIIYTAIGCMTNKSLPLFYHLLYLFQREFPLPVVNKKRVL